MEEQVEMVETLAVLISEVEAAGVEALVVVEDHSHSYKKQRLAGQEQLPQQEEVQEREVQQEREERQPLERQEQAEPQV